MKVNENQNPSTQPSESPHDALAADDPPLTAKQIANWRNAIPELRNATNIEIQLYRDRMQQWCNEDAPERDAEIVQD